MIRPGFLPGFAPPRPAVTAPAPTVAEELALGVTGERFRELGEIILESVAPTIDAEGGVTWVLGPGDGVAIVLDGVMVSGSIDDSFDMGCGGGLVVDWESAADTWEVWLALAYTISGLDPATERPDYTSGIWSRLSTTTTAVFPSSAYRHIYGAIIRDPVNGNSVRAGYQNQASGLYASAANAAINPPPAEFSPSTVASRALYRSGADGRVFLHHSAAWYGTSACYTNSSNNGGITAPVSYGPVVYARNRSSSGTLTVKMLSIHGLEPAGVTHSGWGIGA